MTTDEALRFVREHGIVLESARGAAASLAEAVAGESIRGSWWGHPRGREIFAVTRSVRAAEDVVVCRLIDDKITFVHRRLWPALVRVADRLPAARLARLREIHTETGMHRIEETPFPDWVGPEVRGESEEMSEEAALAALGRVGSVL